MAEKFLSKENTDVLWEVLADDDSVPKTKETQETFVWLLPRFHSSHGKSNINLMDMNKLFIGEMMEKIEEQSKKPTTSVPFNKVLVTVEDLKSERLSSFDKELKEKENDFQSAMAVPVPEEPNFKDDTKDAPLGDVSKEIERMMKERNLDLSNIQKQHNVKKAEEWLSTTLNNKQQTKEIVSQTEEQNIKFIKIENEDLKMSVPTENLDEELPVSKNVTWGENLTINISEHESPPKQPSPVSIFSKLKTSNDTPELPQEKDIDMLFTYVTKRFDDLERKIDSLIPRVHPSLLESVMEDETDDSELGDIPLEP